MQSIKDELLTRVVAAVENGEFEDGSDISDFHNELFNTSYYIHSSYKAKKWLEEHDLDVFEALEQVRSYQKSNFGEENLESYLDYESLVNMVVYIYAEEVMYNLNADSLRDLQIDLGIEVEDEDEDEDE